MTKSFGAYRYVVVESFEPDETSGHHGSVHIRPVKGQIYCTSLFVSCSKRMSNTETYGVGTMFKIRAQLLTRESGAEYLYANPRDPEEVLKPAQVTLFLAGLKRGKL